MTTEETTGEIISLLTAASILAEGPRTVEGCVSRQTLHARRIADHIHQVIKPEDPDRDIDESCAAMQRAVGGSATDDDYDPRGIGNIEDTNELDLWPTPSIFREAKQLINAFDDAIPKDRGLMVLRALGASLHGDEWHIHGGFTIVRDKDAERCASDLSLICDITRWQQFGTEWFSVGWEAEGAWASLSYLGPNERHEPTIEIRVNQCETLATAWCLLIILHDYAVRRGVARLEMTG